MGQTARTSFYNLLMQFLTTQQNCTFREYRRVAQCHKHINMREPSPMSKKNTAFFKRGGLVQACITGKTVLSSIPVERRKGLFLINIFNICTGCFKLKYLCFFGTSWRESTRCSIFIFGRSHQALFYTQTVNCTKLLMTA